MAMRIRSKQKADRDDARRNKGRKSRNNLVGGGIDGTRTEIDGDTPLREFVVSSKAAIADNLGNKCYPGDTAYLDEPTAKFMAERGYIKVEIRFDTGEAKPAATVRAENAEDVSDGGGEEEEVSSTDTGGEQSSGGGEPSTDDEAEGDNTRKPRRRRTSTSDA